MPKSYGRKRKAQFKGNRFTKAKKVEDLEVAADTLSTASTVKLQSSTSSSDIIDSPCNGNIIMEFECMKDVFKKVCCPKCFDYGLNLVEDSRYGLCSHLTLRCQSCEHAIVFSSSKKTNNLPEINARLVYGMRQIGKGYAGAYKLCSTLNLPQMSKRSYENHEARILNAVKEVAEDSMRNAAKEIVQQTKSDKCGVSVDGTWQRRGHTSLNGCVAALSIDTGKVIDLEVMSSYCLICRKLQGVSKDVQDSEKADHVCQCNFQGSSAKMETVGVQRIFKRSVSERNLKYTKYYGDGDSKGFFSVKDVYGLDSVSKFECIGHIQKRVGTRLRKLKAKTKGLSGKGKLTDVFIDRLQNYYGIAVRSNVGNFQGMQQSTIAALFHCASNSKKPMHRQCPAGKDSWCFYQRALAHGEKSIPEKYPGLPNNVLNIIKPLYIELCSKDLLMKCLHGKTQNANECFNGVIWQRVPKEVFVSLKTVKLGAYDAAIQFNDGFKGALNVLNKLGIAYPGYFTEKGYEVLDKSRIRNSIYHSTPAAKKRRKILKASRKKKTTVLVKKEGDHYKKGGF